MVDIIPKKTAEGTFLKNIPLFVVGALLMVMVLGYALMIRFEAANLLSIQDLEADIAKMGAKEDRVMENSVFEAEKNIKGYRALTVNRRKTSRFFDNFALLIHPQVWFSSLSFNPAEISASVLGETFNFETLEQQTLFLKSRSDMVEGLNLSDISFGKEGGVGFNLTINFTPKIFEAPEQ